MVHRYSTAKWIVVTTALATLLGSAAWPAFASDDGYQNVFTSVLTAVGVMPREEAPDIDYRERAPLVVPPKQSLVKPQEPGAGRSAAWPTDPDVVQRKKAQDDARAPIRGGSDRSTDRLMSKEEALKFRATQAPEEPDAYKCSLSQRSESHCRFNPDEMRDEEARYKKMNPEKSETLTAGVEPDRVYLTQPPKGYLKPTKTMTATHEAPVVKRDDSSPLSTYIHPVDGRVDPLDH